MCDHEIICSTMCLGPFVPNHCIGGIWILLMSLFGYQTHSSPDPGAGQREGDVRNEGA